MCASVTRLCLLAAVFCATVALSAAPAGAVAQEEFLSSAGAQAFRDKDFEAALRGFDALLQHYPSDPLILRYIGIANDRLGRFDAAEAAFRQVLRKKPGDVATMFFLAMTEFKIGRRDAAAKGLARVIRAAPGSVYARHAQGFLDEHGLTPSVAATTEIVPRLDAFAQFGIQQDDNVLSASSATTRDHDSPRAFEYLAAVYNVVDTGPWRLRVSGDGYFSQHLDGDLNDLNLQNLGGATAASYATAFGSTPVVAGLGLQYRKAILDASSFSDTVSVESSLKTSFVDDTVTELFHKLDVEEFHNDGFFPAVTSRDGLTNRFGVKQSVYLWDRAVVLFFGYTYSWIAAEGDNFQAFSHDGNVGVSVAMPWKLALDLSGGYGRDDYPQFNGSFNRETDRFDYTVALSRPVVDGVSASLSFRRIVEESNYDSLGYDRNVFTFVLEIRF